MSVLRDAQGRPYINSSGRRVYISPVAFGEKAPADTTGILRSRPQWNQRAGKWETPIDWGNLASMAVAGGLTAGVANAAMAGGAAASGAGGGAGGSLSGLYSAPATITSQGVSSGAGGGGMGFFGTLGRFFGSPGGAQVTDLAGGLASNWMKNRSQNRASDIQGRYNTDALNYLKEQDARDYQEYLKERERGWRYEDEDRGRSEEMRQLGMLREREREGRLAPFRQGAERGYQTLSSLLYDPNQRMAVSPPVGAVQRRSLADLVRG